MTPPTCRDCGRPIPLRAPVHETVDPDAYAALQAARIRCDECCDAVLARARQTRRYQAALGSRRLTERSKTYSLVAERG